MPFFWKKFFIISREREILGVQNRSLILADAQRSAFVFALLPKVSMTRLAQRRTLVGIGSPLPDHGG